MKKREIALTEAAIKQIGEILKSDNDAVLRVNHRTNTIDVIEQRIKIKEKIPVQEVQEASYKT